MPTYSPDQISAFWSGVAAISTGAAAATAIFTLLALRRDSSDRTRPVMSAELRPEVLSQGTSLLIVTNSGHTAAKDVTVKFDPSLPDLQGPEAAGKVTPYLYRRYSETIPTVAPGMELRNVYTIGIPDGSGRLVNDEPVPERFTITFNYTDGHGKKYVDSYVLSVSVLINETHSNPSNTDEKGMEKRRIRALEAIAKGIGRR